MLSPYFRTERQELRSQQAGGPAGKLQRPDLLCKPKFYMKTCIFGLQVFLFLCLLDTGIAFRGRLVPLNQMTQLFSLRAQVPPGEAAGSWTAGNSFHNADPRFFELLNFVRIV